MFNSQRIKKDCFWDLDISSDEILNIANGDDTQKRSMLFEKILLNSTSFLNDLEVFEIENEFYLTGGTCLSRFYVEKRYSDDLGFFANQSPRYSFAIRNIKKALNENFQLAVEVESKDFTIFKIDDLLQVDFVNDISFRYKEPIVSEENYLIDTIEELIIRLKSFPVSLLQEIKIKEISIF